MSDKAGLYREADTGGTPGGGSEAGNDSNRIAELEGRVADLQGSLDEQRTIQSGLDRTVSRREERIHDLEENLERYRTIANDSEGTLRDVTEERDTLTDQVSELEGTQEELDRVRRNYSRLQIVMNEHPELSYLAANDALPQAEDDDEFRTKLGAIAEAGNFAAENRANEKLSGGRPPASPPSGQGEESAEDLWTEGNRLIDRGEVTEGNKLIDKYWATKE